MTCINGKCLVPQETCFGPNCNKSKSPAEPDTISTLTAPKQGNSANTAINGFKESCFGGKCSPKKSTSGCRGGSCEGVSSNPVTFMQKLFSGGFLRRLFG